MQPKLESLFLALDPKRSGTIPISRAAQWFLGSAAHIGIPPEDVIVNRCIQSYCEWLGLNQEQMAEITMDEWLRFFGAVLTDQIPNVRVDKPRLVLAVDFLINEGTLLMSFGTMAL
eukprot:TRINITY_DN5678_c0_g1_i1.p1 TRINITY_DN5678_c0_g1~~TRINITY_DN5678_c0_g1_i1.p1  ORF type:complete len:116 (-),score=25.08 TRINITY_DN5678_c0_g1_i1:128-475(-)